jgi:translation initiation factor 4G
MKLGSKLLTGLILQALLYALDKSDVDQERVSALCGALKDQGVISPDSFTEAFKALLTQLGQLETDNLLAKSHIARYGAHAVSSGVAPLGALAGPLVGGACYPLFLLLLQQLAKLRDQDWLVATFKESKVNLLDMLPERNRDKMAEILEDRGLSFLFPFLRIQSELWKQLEGAEPNPVTYYKWIKDNVDARLHADPTFITLLVTTVVRYVTAGSTLREGVDVSSAPSKADTDMETQLLNKFKGVLQKFLLDKLALHVTALYAVQVYAHSNNNPKGLVLRMFEALYDMGVVYEEAFLQWKEEVNELHPGKGKALFQVNQWLMWLEQASEESDDEG